MSENHAIDALIAIFAKPPVPGLVKTRLIPELGAGGAAQLAAAFIHDVIEMSATLEWAQCVIATTGSLDNSSFPPVPPGMSLWDQGDGDLGARMERILARGLAEGAESAIALGADSPGLTAGHLDNARKELERHDAVLGPTSDGGYYLIGFLGQCPEGILDDLPWSSTETFDATSNRLQSHGLSVGIIDQFFDIDEPADLHRFIEGLRLGQLRAPASEALLREMKLL